MFRRPRSRRALAGMLAAAVCGVPLWNAAPVAAAGRTSPAVPATPALGTPLLSMRRVPDTIEETAAGTRMAPALVRALVGAGSGVDQSCLVVTQGDSTLYQYHATREVLPASNMKLLTATAVLQRLGASTRLTTWVGASAAPVAGVVHGDLYLVGSGDPLLFTKRYDLEQDPPEPLYTNLATLAARVRKAGITQVDGSVLGDEALFDTQRGVVSWKPSYEAEGDVGPLSALEVNNGFSLTPPEGAAAQPAVMAAEVFTGLLKNDGVKVDGPGGKGTAPAAASTVASIESAPLGQEVDAILRVSDDTGAELLTKLLGRRLGAGGTTAAGVGVVRATLAADGLPVSQLHQVDGSGLSRDDRVTCNLVADVLRRAGPSSVLFDGLPVAGETGTLADRMYGTPAMGRLHAKTGTLDGVSALSGFVLPAAGRDRANPELDTPLVFSMILNGLPPTVNGDDVGDAVGEALATAPPPPLADAEPLADRG